MGCNSLEGEHSRRGSQDFEEGMKEEEVNDRSEKYKQENPDQ
jgi:hypothetical protein